MNQTGVIFYSTSNNQDLACTGTSVTTGSRGPTLGIVETAAHCPEDPTNGFQPFSNIMFAPGYQGWVEPADPTPFGEFPDVNIIVRSSWVGSPNFQDQGFLKVAVNSNHETLQCAVGAALLAPNNSPRSDLIGSGGNPVTPAPGSIVGYNAPQLSVEKCSGGGFTRDGNGVWYASVCPANPGWSGGPLWQADPCSATCQALDTGDIAGHSAATGLAFGQVNDINTLAMYNGFAAGGGTLLPAPPGQILSTAPSPTPPAQPAQRVGYYTATEQFDSDRLRVTAGRRSRAARRQRERHQGGERRRYAVNGHLSPHFSVRCGGAGCAARRVRRPARRSWRSR